jgi:hypothetical protein
MENTPTQRDDLEIRNLLLEIKKLIKDGKTTEAFSQAKQLVALKTQLRKKNAVKEEEEENYEDELQYSLMLDYTSGREDFDTIEYKPNISRRQLEYEKEEQELRELEEELK